jgi:hypothetical protein
MQTYSHFLITASLNRPLWRWGLSVHTIAFLIGSVLPDIPFLLLTLGYGVYYLWINPMAPNQTAMSVMETMHFDLFYRDPIWIIGHNFFHAPLILLMVGLIGFRLRHHWRWGNLLLWFTVGAGLHTAIDILSHHSDGPLIFFPFNWRYRFASPISYWESEYYAWLVFPIEHILDASLLLYWGWSWWQRRRTLDPRR